MAKNSALFTARMLRSWTFAFFFAALLSASVISYAEIVGFDDFDGGKSGWDWDGTGTAQEWAVSSGSFTREDDGTGNMRAKVNGQAFLYYGSSSQLNSGTFAYTFDFQFISNPNTWGGLSLYNGSTEVTFLGHVSDGGYARKLLSRQVNPRINVATADDYLGTNKTYAVVANSSGIFT